MDRFEIGGILKNFFYPVQFLDGDDRCHLEAFFIRNKTIYSHMIFVLRTRKPGSPPGNRHSFFELYQIVPRVQYHSGREVDTT